jgi:hypothetical protein
MARSDTLPSAAAHGRASRWLDRLRAWPDPGWFLWLDRRFGLYLVTLAAIYGLKWRNGYDLNAFMIAARDVADGKSAYARTVATGVSQWGTDQVYVSPPFVAHLLAPFRDLPGDVLFAAWSIAGLAAVAVAIRLLDPETLARRAPRLVFFLGYVWATVFLGQVNLFVLAGLLLALGCRNDRLSGFGLAMAVLFRGTPALFAVELVIQRRWRALGWSAIVFGVGVVLSDPGEWVTYAGLAREIAAVPTLLVPPQTSLMSIGWPMAAVAALAMAAVLVLARRVPTEAGLLRGTTIGLALVLLPGNAWVHWFAFALAPLLLAGDRGMWSRRALLAFMLVAFYTDGWPSVAVGLVTLAAMTQRVILARNTSGFGIATYPRGLTTSREGTDVSIR